MSSDEQDVDIESDEDENEVDSGSSSCHGTGLDGDGVDKRAHHNALERKRRDHIKDSFNGLKDSIPSMQGNEKMSRASSRAQILKKATEYIQFMRRKNVTHQEDIDDLKKQNVLLEQQIRALERAKSDAGVNASGAATQISAKKVDGTSNDIDGHRGSDYRKDNPKPKALET